MSEFSSPSKVTGVRLARDEEEAARDKRTKHCLEIIPLELGPANLGFMVGSDGMIDLARKSPKKRGRPRGSKNKKMASPLTYDSMASPSGTTGMMKNPEAGGGLLDLGSTSEVGNGSEAA